MAYPDKPSSMSDTGPGTTITPSSVLTMPPIAQFFGVASVGCVGVVLLVSAIVGGMSLASTALAGGTFAAAMLIAANGLMRMYAHHTLGWCNTVTIIRMMLVSVILATTVAPPVSDTVLIGLVFVAFALDGVDGWLARREQLVSEFGARFDMEVDSVLAVTLAVLAYQNGAVGAWVLLLGAPRYAFWAAQMAWPWLKTELPPRFSRKVICVFQLAVLIALLLPIWSPHAAQALAALALSLVGWSFWVDVRWLARAQV